MPKISITLHGNSLELEGDEAFIQSHLKLIKEIKVPSNLQDQTTHTVNQATEQHTVPKDISVSQKFPYIYDVEDDNFTILTTDLGSNNAEKVRNLTLLHLYGKLKVLGNSATESNELRDLAEDFACLDSKNFAASLSSARSYFRPDGIKGGLKTYTLTRPGEKAAEKLATQLNSREASKENL